jgi:hypothetical protein
VFSIEQLARAVVNRHFLQVFSSVNIADSKLMREMTEAAVRDSAGMSQGKNVVQHALTEYSLQPYVIFLTS